MQKSWTHTHTHLSGSYVIYDLMHKWWLHSFCFEATWIHEQSLESQWMHFSRYSRFWGQKDLAPYQWLQAFVCFGFVFADTVTILSDISSDNERGRCPLCSSGLLSQRHFFPKTFVLRTMQHSETKRKKQSATEAPLDVQDWRHQHWFCWLKENPHYFLKYLKTRSKIQSAVTATG